MARNPEVVAALARTRFWDRAVVGTVALTGVLALAGCQKAEVRPDYQYDGRNLYLGYCASCHGVDGAGDGPVAAAFSNDLPDLRMIEARDGVFPAEWLKEVIDGRTLRSAHGTKEMPVWGWQFRLANDSEAEVAARIDALVTYLRSVQATN